MAVRLILVVLLAAHCAATTIVLIRRPDQLIVGADSHVVRWQPLEGSRTAYTCKLHKEQSIFFAIAGMGIVHSATKFSAEQLVRQAISSSHSMDEAAARFMRMGTVPYARVARAMRTEDPEGWRLIEQHNGSGIPLVVILFGFEHHTPKYVIVGFRVTTGTRTRVLADRASCPGPACEDAIHGQSALVLGESEAAYRRIGAADQISFSRFRDAIGDVHTVKQLIAVEAAAVPNAVGGPVHVVTLDAAGEHWDEDAGICK